MKLAWSVLWRVFLFQLALSLVIVFSTKNTALFSDPSLMFWKPSVLWAAYAVALLFGQAALSNGLLHLLWGKNLRQGALFWSGLSYSLAALFLVLTLINIGIAKTVPLEIWLKLKTLAPLAFLMVFVFTVPAWLVARSNNTMQPTAGSGV